ncbi:MAG: 50S ribosomal protein L30 [Methylococcaceae bacterium]|nr:50S ribosomal protein L30 [Methylococcaceae bacterium]MDZ4157077.1 50S ribosomal protein L30 [Methylococcales bacterium]MDP2394168.1 50S ribosomal protein L30 [Methylococcaceae bacterium]MDP3019996.1 50S ribosomal protein L30 [Methylococcaceae bacterium]MDP3388738.1 50S ribosomal protein L30 [Methylococcaceae bacterium]
MSNSTLSVTMIKSKNGRLPSHKACIKGLGLRKINHSVVLEDTLEIRGMINKVSYMLKIREL